jgi:hypothetical protein
MLSKFSQVVVRAEDIDVLTTATSAWLTIALPEKLFSDKYVLRSEWKITRGTNTIACFADWGYLRLGVNLSNGNVVEVRRDGSVVPGEVNSSVEQFVETVRAVLDRYPFHGPSPSDDEVEAAADRIRNVIVDIDPLAVKNNLLWSQVIDAIRMGDFDPAVVRDADWRMVSK